MELLWWKWSAYRSKVAMRPAAANPGAVGPALVGTMGFLNREDRGVLAALVDGCYESHRAIGPYG